MYNKCSWSKNYATEVHEFTVLQLLKHNIYKLFNNNISTDVAR